MAVMTMGEAQVRFSFHPVVAAQVPVEVVAVAMIPVQRRGLLGRGMARVKAVASVRVPEWQNYFAYYSSPRHWNTPRSINVLPA